MSSDQVAALDPSKILASKSLRKWTTGGLLSSALLGVMVYLHQDIRSQVAAVGTRVEAMDDRDRSIVERLRAVETKLEILVERVR